MKSIILYYVPISFRSIISLPEGKMQKAEIRRLDEFSTKLEGIRHDAINGRLIFYKYTKNVACV